MFFGLVLNCIGSNRYRSTSNVKLPIRIIPSVTEVGTTQVQYTITLKTIFNNKLSATNVVLRIPTPLNATNADCKVANGKAKYVPEENVIVWKLVCFVLSFSLLVSYTSLIIPNRIAKLQGGQECTLIATALLTSTTTRQVWARPPIDVDFQVLMFTASGLIVRFLKVFEKSNYQSIKWVRYLTKASGSYQVRVCVFFFVLFWYWVFWKLMGSAIFSFDLMYVCNCGLVKILSVTK